MAEKDFDFYKYQKKYQRENLVQKVCRFNRNTDGDIFDWIEDVGNFQGYVKQLIRADIRKAANEKDAVLERAVKAFGKEHQEWVLVGEVGELLDAVADHKRGRCDVRHIAEEIADVEIMLEQMKIIYDCRDAVTYWRRVKRERLDGYAKGVKK